MKCNRHGCRSSTTIGFEISQNDETVIPGQRRGRQMLAACEEHAAAAWKICQAFNMVATARRFRLDATCGRHGWSEERKTVGSIDPLTGEKGWGCVCEEIAN